MRNAIALGGLFAVLALMGFIGCGNVDRFAADGQLFSDTPQFVIQSFESNFIWGMTSSLRQQPDRGYFKKEPKYGAPYDETYADTRKADKWRVERESWQVEETPEPLQ